MFRQFLLILCLMCLPTFIWAEQKILVLGDSNTWGSNASGPRHGEAVRWGKILGAHLFGVTVIEEGRIGRRTDLDQGHAFDPLTDPLPELIAQHMPLDLVVVMLGTNDLQNGRNSSAIQIARSAFELALLITAANGFTQKPRALVVVPPPLTNPEHGTLGNLFGRRSAQLSKQLASAFAVVAADTNAEMFDAGSITTADGRDGVHLTAEAHFQLGRALVPVVKQLLENSPQ